MTKIYRFRSINAAISQFAEISKQEIYLASPHEMNDPNEGILNVSWNADEVAWDGFIEHFLRTSIITQSSTPLEQEMSGGVIVPGYNNLTHQAEGHARDVGNLPEIQSARRTTASELYGNTFDADALARALKPLNDRVHETLRRYRFSGATLIPIVYETSGGRSVPRFSMPPTPSEWAWRLPAPPHEKVPTLYASKIAELTTRAWYAACFSNTFESQAMWLHYAQSRQGICMEFETDDLQFDGCSFLDVQYEQQLPMLDFFPYLTRITEAEALAIYQSGSRKSVLKPDWTVEEDRMGWHKEVDGRTKRVALTKTNDWQAEQEVRLLRVDLFDKGPSHVIYPSRALTGIIFGEQATEDTKNAVRSIMISKHRHSPIGDFIFYDAYTTPNGTVWRRPCEQQLWDI